MKCSPYAIVVLVLLSNPLFAQVEHKKESHEVEHKNGVALFVGNTIILQSGFNLPTLGVEYVREVNPSVRFRFHFRG